MSNFDSSSCSLSAPLASPTASVSSTNASTPPASSVVTPVAPHEASNTDRDLFPATESNSSKSRPYAQASFPARSSPVGLSSSKLPPVSPGSRGYIAPIQLINTGVIRRRTLSPMLHSASLDIASNEPSNRQQEHEAQLVDNSSDNITASLLPSKCNGPKYRHRRSDSLLKYPPPEVKHPTTVNPFRLVGTVEDLPSNPKSWTPSQLALFLAHILKLIPAPIIQDLINLVFQHGFTGRKFLRLR